MRRLMTGLLAGALVSGACGPAAAGGRAMGHGGSPPGAIVAPGGSGGSLPRVGTARARWSVQHTPAVAGVTLEGVSCASAAACTATGARTAGNISRTAAESWNGTAWSLRATPAIPGGSDSFLRAVSCTAASCVAVGDYWNGSRDVTLAERWNGTNWSVEPTPNPTGARGSFLFGVSCMAATACTAVGDFINGAGFTLTLAERWAGSAWSVQPTPSPAHAQQSVLEAVSCAAVTACTAVGQSADASGASKTLAEAWHGSAWSIQPTPDPVGAQLNTLAAVSCPAATACTAVGNDSPAGGTLTLAESWDGSSWSIQPTPGSPAAADSYLTGVSCISPAACTAAGHFLTHAGANVTLAEGWHGKAWSIQATAGPAGAVDSLLDGVSCTSAIDCTAVGAGTSAASVTTALAERHSAS